MALGHHLAWSIPVCPSVDVARVNFALAGILMLKSSQVLQP